MLAREDQLDRFDKSRAVKIMGTSLVSGSERDPNDFDHHLGKVAADRAYDMAGVSPEDVDVAEVHDASAYAEIVQVENMGFCARG